LGIENEELSEYNTFIEECKNDKEIQEGLHTERDKNDALEIWVNDLDGKEIENDEQNAGMIKFCE